MNPGTRLGPYQIISSIGVGGMGEVYRARDTRLNRDVAVKTLPELFAADADRVARFEREAQTLASLNHPNIAHIYGIEDRALVRASDLPSEIVSVDRTGSLSVVGPLQGQAFDAGQWPVMALSHDSRLLAIGITAPAGNELWKYDLERGITTRLTTDSGVVVNPVWSVDGSRVLFAAFAGHRVWNVFAVSSGETGKPERIMPPADESQWPCSLSPDGRSLIYVQVSSGNMDLWVTTFDGTAGHPLLTKTPFNESDAAFSPDGHAIAYTSDESGRTEVYVRAFPIDARRTPVSTGGGAHPRWSRDGSELFYRIGSGIASARITRTAAGVDASNSGPLFKVGSDATMSASFAVAPDGQHFLFARSTGADRLSVILNWTSQLRR